MTSLSAIAVKPRLQSRRRLSRFKGVRRRSWGKWVAEIRIPNSRERLWLGSYPNALQAARAYDIATACLRGPGAILNLPLLPLPAQTPACLSPTSIRNLAAQEAANLSPQSHAFGTVSAPSSPAPSVHRASSPTLNPPVIDALEGHGDLLSATGNEHHHSHHSCNVQHSNAQQPAAQGAVDDDAPSLLDLWCCLDVSPSVDPHLRALINHFPANCSEK